MNRSHLEFLASDEWAEMLRIQLLPWVLSAGDLGDDILEIGPGPGRTTDLLRERVARVTAVEVDPSLTRQLRDRLAGTNVHVVEGDGTNTGFESGSFSAATSFSVLHHIPRVEDQDRLLAEVGRVLRPGGLFVGQDSLDTEMIRLGHADDIFNPLPVETLVARFERAGLSDVRLDQDDFHVRFAARKPG
jgi:SAM-dependent methyltransferase